MIKNLTECIELLNLSVDMLKTENPCTIFATLYADKLKKIAKAK